MEAGAQILISVYINYDCTASSSSFSGPCFLTQYTTHFFPFHRTKPITPTRFIIPLNSNTTLSPSFLWEQLTGWKIQAPGFEVVEAAGRALPSKTKSTSNTGSYLLP